jgi:transposase-like protein
MGAGRPTTYGKGRHEAICKSLEVGMSRTTAAELIGINRSTLETWREKYPAFNHDVTQAMAKAKARATVTITTAIRAGDVNAAFRYLSLQEREEWREVKDINLTVQVREKAERIAAELGLSTDEVMAEAEMIASGVWDAWQP